MDAMPWSEKQIFDCSGFSLAELLVVLAVLSILTTLALPTYERYRNRALRSSAGAVLLQCAMGAERRASIDFSYTGLDADKDGIADIPSCPASVQHAGADAYRIQVATSSDTEFEILAQPVVGSAVAQNGFLGINHKGIRFWDKNDDGEVQEPDEQRWQD